MGNITKNIEESSTLPSTFYSSKELFFEAVNSVFSRSWHLVSDQSKLDIDKSVLPFILMEDLIPEPLFLVNLNNEISCYSNVCTHRGNLLVNDPGLLKHGIMCGYHGRRFDLSGKFVSMPETKGMKDFPCENDDLPKVPCQKWRQFIFTGLNPKISINDLVSDMEKRISWMPIEDFEYREDLSKQYEINANWALYCDNYLEGFHIPFIHNDLNAVLDYENYDVDLFPYSNLQIGYSNDKEICFDLPEESYDYGENIAAYYFWLFPNMMFNFYPWGLSLNIITPLSIDKTKVEFKSYVWKEDLLKKGAGADVDKVELEDQKIVQNVHKGVKSRLYNHGRFSPKMEKGVHHFHTLLQSYCNFLK